MKHTISKYNPSFKLYKSHENSLNYVKTLLFDELEDISPSLSKQLDLRLSKRKARNPLPYLGELYPFVIAHLTDLTQDKNFKEVTTGWLSIYYYTILLDDYLDKANMNPSSKDLLMLSVLFQKGMLKLQKAILNTPYENRFMEAINSTLKSEFLELALKNKDGCIELKSEYSSGKNDLLKLCSFALISLCSSKKDINFINQFTSKLQLCFQYLDDIADLKEDWLENNNTVIISSLLKTQSKAILHPENLIEKLIESRVLSEFILELSEMMADIVDSLELTFNEKKSPEHIFFNSLNKNILEFSYYLQEIDIDEFTSLEPTKKYKIIDDVEKHIQMAGGSS